MKSDNQGGSAHGGRQAGERRVAKRVGSRRAVVFSDYEAKGPLRTGTVTDISSGGFRIATRYPEASGGEVQVELAALSGDAAAISMYRGRVVYVTAREDGAALMGVQLIPNPAEAWQGVAGARGLDRTFPAASSVGTHKHRGVSTPTPRPRKVTARTRSRRTRLALAPLFALLVILFFLTMEAVNGERQRDPRGPVRSALADDPGTPDFLPASPSGGSASGSIAERPTSEGLDEAGVFDWTRRGGIDALLFDAHASLEEGNLPAAETLFAELERRGDANPVQRFASRLGYAEAAAARGDERLARAVLRKAMRFGDVVPEPWLRAGEALEKRLAKAQRPYRAAPMSTALEVIAPSGEERPTPPLRIEVDTSRYTLRVLKGDAVLQSFPVGLGENGATPLGTFEIANKLVDPAWYNRGDVVPAGDARNPIGARWMGLGDGTAATPYGIHPTNDAGSIGRAASAGCIRMRPDDAKAVYRLAPIGTPVRIFR